MDQPISCKDIHHIYKHPLSILIHLKYQDKDGCSKNGSREFLFSITLDGSNIEGLLRCSILDSRRVPIDISFYTLSCYEMDDERIILGFKQLNLNIQSQIPIVQEEREAVTYLLSEGSTMSSQYNEKISNILDNPSLGSRYISSVCGHAIGVQTLLQDPINFKPSNHSKLLSSLTQLQHLRSLKFDLEENWENQEQFYEELGDQLGSKLFHLDLQSSCFKIHTLEFLSNQMFKFSILKTLRLSTNIKRFNTSL